MKTLSQWDSSADWYDRNMGEEGDTLNKEILRPLVFQLLGNVVNKTILDSGCGSGYLAAELTNKAYKVIGTDFSRNFVSLCKKKYKHFKNLSFMQCNVTEKMPFDDKSFDIILSKMVLQYVPRLDVFSKESLRTLQNHGTLIVIVDHPFHSQFYFAQQAAGRANSKYPTLYDYFSGKEQKKFSLWGKVELTWYPKTVTEYIIPFIKVGMHLIDIKEIPEIKGNLKIPRILALKFIK